MMHMSKSLGVNCTYCHNTPRVRDLGRRATPPRVTAWYGIRMVRDLNNNYLVPLTDDLPGRPARPDRRRGKIDCATCHQGAFKPLYGAPMLKDYPELAGPRRLPAHRRSRRRRRPPVDAPPRGARGL